jgi:hypothetical protein
MDKKYKKKLDFLEESLNLENVRTYSKAIFYRPSSSDLENVLLKESDLRLRGIRYRIEIRELDTWDEKKLKGIGSEPEGINRSQAVGHIR